MRHLHLHASLIAIAASGIAPGAAVAQNRAAEQAPAAGEPAKPADRKPDAIVVTGKQTDVSARADRVSFNVANDLQVQTGTLADALRSVPGVEVSLDGQVSLRGEQGVKILVDGRPSALFSGEGQSNAVMTMPAGQIERVEVITNPSAAMSPEGGGVINLIMKRARRDSRNATVRGNVGAEGRRAMSLNATHSGSGLTATGDLNYRRFAGDAEIVQNRTRTDPGGSVTSRRDQDLEMMSTGRNVRTVLDYDLGKSNRLSAEANYFRFGNAVDSEERFESSAAAGSYERDADVAIASRGVGGRASWRRTFAGQDHELVSEVGGLRGRFRRAVESTTTPASSALVFERFRNAGDWAQNNVKVDYKRPMGKDASLNLGYNGDFNRHEFDFTGGRGPSFADLTPLAAFTNQFEYDETIHAVFGTYNFHVGKLEAMTGLRLEKVGLDIDQITDDLQFENDYFRAYPTLHLGYDLSRTQKVRASYSRRIQRPQPPDLNPYTLYLDPQNLRRGNPFLQPQVTDSYEMSWQFRKGGAFYSLTGFYRDVKDGVTDVFTDLGGGVILTTRANLATSTSVGLEAIANGKLTRTLTYNASGTYQWMEIDPRVGGISQRNSGTTGTLRGNFNWQPTGKDFFQLNGNYSGRQLLPQGYREPGGVLNLGYRRKVNEKLSLLLTGQNVLDSARQSTFFRTPTVEERSRQIGTGRVLLFGATYTLGSTGGRQKREPGFDFQQGGGDPVQ